LSPISETQNPSGDGELPAKGVFQSSNGGVRGQFVLLETTTGEDGEFHRLAEQPNVEAEL
jgi:hypothetical protein